jgi:hypothetical protein
MSIDLDPLNAGRSATRRRIVVVCLVLCLVVTGSPVTAAAASGSEQQADDCEIQLDPPEEAEYDVHVVGYTASANTYHVTLSGVDEALACTGEVINHARAVRNGRVNRL